MLSIKTTIKSQLNRLAIRQPEVAPKQGFALHSSYGLLHGADSGSRLSQHFSNKRSLDETKRNRGLCS